MQYSNVIDTPRAAGSKDLLGVEKSIRALVRFIGTAQMPTTLAIQGEWGSGKTSLMNQVRHALCEDAESGDDTDKDKPFYGIWVNTWQYSLMRSPEDVLLHVISGITHEVLSILQRRHQSRLENTLDAVKGMLGRLALVGAKAAAVTAGVSASAVDVLVSSSKTRSEVVEFREKLAGAIKECLRADEETGAGKRGFLFFIDDLDRLDPPVAVQILELLKNLFEVDHCVFVLAIDYDVVVKGLVPKFGPLTSSNEREFRSFFDKLIQLPFTMPVRSYQIEKYLAEALKKIGYYTPQELQESGYYSPQDLQEQDGDAPLIEVLTQMVKLSTGANPRSVKRLINTLSLINIMQSEAGDGEALTARERLLSFGTVCVQIAYPSIYNMLLMEPGFTQWDKPLARSLRLPELSEEELENIAPYEEFEQEWQKLIYRAGQGNAWLGSRVFSVSRLLQLIADNVPEDEDLEEVMERVLGMAAVATVASEAAAVSSVRQEAKSRERVRLASEEEFYRQREADGVSTDSLNMVRAWRAGMQALFGDLVTYSYNPKVIFVHVAHSKDKRTKTLLRIKPRKRVISYNLIPLHDYKHLNLPTDAEGKAQLYDDLLEGYNKLADDAHQLGKDALSRALPQVPQEPQQAPQASQTPQTLQEPQAPQTPQTPQ